MLIDRQGFLRKYDFSMGSRQSLSRKVGGEIEGKKKKFRFDDSEAFIKVFVPSARKNLLLLIMRYVPSRCHTSIIKTVQINEWKGGGGSVQRL